MPLGNLTSQFFANVYLNELDYFVKHKLKIKYYIRYVDDFVIIHRSKEKIEEYNNKINHFLTNRLSIQLHPDKSKIIQMNKGINFLGLKILQYHKIIQKKNRRQFTNKLNNYVSEYKENNMNYDKIYDFLEGWLAYTKHTNSYKLRNKITSKIEKTFHNEISTKEINRIIKLSTDSTKNNTNDSL